MIELVAIYRTYLSGGRFASRYKKTGYWVVRSLIAVAGGLLAIFHNVTTDLLAAQIGITAPAVLMALSQKPSKDSERSL